MAVKKTSTTTTTTIVVIIITTITITITAVVIFPAVARHRIGPEKRHVGVPRAVETRPESSHQVAVRRAPWTLRRAMYSEAQGHVSFVGTRRWKRCPLVPMLLLDARDNEALRSVVESRNGEN